MLAPVPAAPHASQGLSSLPLAERNNADGFNPAPRRCSPRSCCRARSTDRTTSRSRCAHHSRRRGCLRAAPVVCCRVHVHCPRETDTATATATGRPADRQERGASRREAHPRGRHPGRSGTSRWRRRVASWARRYSGMCLSQRRRRRRRRVARGPTWPSGWARRGVEPRLGGVMALAACRVCVPLLPAISSV